MDILLRRKTRKVQLTNRPRLRTAISQAVLEAGLETTGAVEGVLGVVFVGSRLMRRMNRLFLQHDWVTDVIAFDLRGEGPSSAEPAIGEILVCPAMALENSARLGVEPERELMLYIVHGLLHLGGFDDVDASERSAMEDEQERILCELLKRFTFNEFFSLDG